jgi:hypothetical protein
VAARAAHRARGADSLAGRFHPQLRDKNRGDIGKYQSKWTMYKKETPGSQP